jgi:hypothetical protein
MRTRDPVGPFSAREEATANVFYHVPRHMLTSREYTCGLFLA